jgi:lipid A disaccharide synthetase
MALGVDSLPLTAHLGHDIKTAASNYVSPDIFSWEDKRKIKLIIGDLYEK